MDLEEVVATVLRVASEVLGVGTVDPEQNFFSLGGDSLLAVEMVVRLEDLGLTAELRDIFVVDSLGQLGERLTQRDLGGEP